MATKEFEAGKSKHKMYLEARTFILRFNEDLKENEDEELNGNGDDPYQTSDELLDEYRESLEEKKNFWMLRRQFQLSA